MHISLNATLCAFNIASVAGCVKAATITPGQPAIESLIDLTTFEGTRLGQADMGIQNLWEELDLTQGVTAYWFNQNIGASEAITTSKDRYSNVDMLLGEDC